MTLPAILQPVHTSCKRPFLRSGRSENTVTGTLATGGLQFARDDGRKMRDCESGFVG
jgi:hypothetical protein